jgi:hypothetical protein
MGSLRSPHKTLLALWAPSGQTRRYEHGNAKLSVREAPEGIGKESQKGRETPAQAGGRCDTFAFRNRDHSTSGLAVKLNGPIASRSQRHACREMRTSGR